MAGQRFPGIHSGVKLPRGSFCVACPVRDADGSHERGGRGGSPRTACPGTGGVGGEVCVPEGTAHAVYTRGRIDDTVSKDAAPHGWARTLGLRFLRERCLKEGLDFLWS